MLSEFVIINGHIKLFQVVTKVKIARVTTTGSASGSAILKKVWNKLQPSILAASSRSFGSERKYCLVKNIPNPPKSPGRIKAGYVSTKFNSLIKKNSGMIFTCGGTIIVISTTRNQKSLCLKFNLAKEYPASEDKITCPKVVNNATIILFIKNLVTGIAPKTCLKFSKVKFIENKLFMFLKISSWGVRANFSMAKNGNNMLSAIAIKIKYPSMRTNFFTKILYNKFWDKS